MDRDQKVVDQGGHGQLEVVDFNGLDARHAAYLGIAIKEYVKTFSGICGKNDSAVVVFGTSRANPFIREAAYKLGQGLAKLNIRLGQGGGKPNSVMRGCSDGCAESGGDSIAMCIRTWHEDGQVHHDDEQPYHLDTLEMRTLALLEVGALFVIFMRPGFGTLAELYTLLAKIQLRKMPKAPVLAVGRFFLAIRILHWLMRMLGTIRKDEADLIRYFKSIPDALKWIDRYWTANNLPRVSRESSATAGLVPEEEAAALCDHRREGGFRLLPPAVADNKVSIEVSWGRQGELEADAT